MSKGVAGGQGGPGTHMLRGSAWMIAMRWAIRLTGLISTIILARLLTPEDFGVVAIAMIVVGMFGCPQPNRTDRGHYPPSRSDPRTL